MSKKDVTSPNSLKQSSQHQTFSPVTVPESPVSKTPQRGNLTGNPRKIRDSAADIYNLIQEWNGHQLEGYEILLEINLLKSRCMKDAPANNENSYPDGLLDLCNKLDKICSFLDGVVKRMLTLRCEVGGVIKLENVRGSSDTPMFLTWPAEQFGESVKMITDSYEKELSLKFYIKENIAHAKDEANLMFFIASWTHQPYLGAELDVQLEALVKETGLR